MEKVNKKILVVDDEKDALEYIVEILKSANYEVISTISGYEAVELAKKNLPDIIILDIVLPDIDGGSVASILSEDKDTSNIPIIFLTGIIRKQEQELLKSKKYKIIAKPIVKEEILKVIDETFSS